jgi:hypothetical protein
MKQHPLSAGIRRGVHRRRRARFLQSSDEARVTMYVMRALGTPFDLLKVQVRPICDNRYRVNIVVGANAGSARIANSFFIVSDSDGRVISATPPITKQY